MKKLASLLAVVSLLLVFAAPLAASADVNDFTVTNFSADETLTRDDPQGELHVVETIAVDFTDQNHGILRAIPTEYKKHSLQLKVNSVTSPSGAPASYATYGSNGNTVLKIGDANRTVTGAQEYKIDYTLSNVISFYKDHDELYWDVNGDQWSQPFEQVSVTLHLPSGLQQSRAPVCYSGSFGSTAQDCTITTAGSTITAVTTAPLLSNQTLTYVAGFSSGYFAPSKWYETTNEYAVTISKVVLPIVLIGGGGFLLWFKKGRDAKGTGIIVPQYEAPDGLKPIQVGTIADFKVDNRDISATIIDLAIRGYLKIVENKKDRLIGKDKLSYTLELKNADYTGLDQYERLILDALFNTHVVGEVIDVSVLKNTLYTTARTLGNDVDAGLTADGYFRNNPFSNGKAIGGAVGLAVFGAWFGSKLLGAALVIGLVIGVLLAYAFQSKMASRTAKGVAAKEHIEGLKLYLNVAEKDRINKLQAPNAAYATPSAEPARTVELFEKLLPYAMVLGVENQWAKQFESLYLSPPDWYGGNWTTFNAVYLASSLNGLGATVNSAFTAPSSSGSSGFGGGGFSGGGGGGGGGGGW